MEGSNQRASLGPLTAIMENQNKELDDLISKGLAHFATLLLLIPPKSSRSTIISPLSIEVAAKNKETCWQDPGRAPPNIAKILSNISNWG